MSRAAALILVVPILALALCLSVDAAYAGLLVTTGEITPTTAVVWARGDAVESLAIEATAPDGQAVKGTLHVTPERDLTGTVTLTGLRPATRYTYEIRSSTESVGGAFVTAPPADSAAPVKLIWSGDLGGGGFCRRPDGGYPIFRTMAAAQPDFFLFVGDTIYGDVPCDRPGVVPGSAYVARTLSEFHRKHRYNREDAAVQAFFRSTSVYAVWDDHEVLNDFSGPAEPLMPIGRRAFPDYWPIVPPVEERERLYRRVRWGALLEVFVLDTRQYRSPNVARDGPGKTMLGATQRRWLIDGVTSSRALWKVVVTSVPLSVPTGSRERHDSWSNANVWGTPEENGTGFAVERDAILRAFRERGVRDLIFLAADVHHAELIRHHPTPSFSFHEFIAGPLSATFGKPRPLDQALNPRSLFAHAGTNNFGEIEIAPARLTVRLIAEGGTVLFTHTIGPE